VSSTPTDHTDICATCEALVRWHEHSPDAVNPIGLWHHDDEAVDEDHGPAPRANMAAYDASAAG
jgi:hypothetical protein